MTTTTDDIRRQQGHQQHDTRTMTSLAVSIKPKNTTGAAVLLRLLAMATSLALPLATNATFIYEVSPYGEPYSLAGALAEAGPGDIVSLANGTYDEPLVTVAGGEDGNPLVIEGGPEAVFNAYTGDRDKVVYVQHSWVTLRGFTVDGRIAEEEVLESFIDKCVYVEGYGEPTTHTYLGGSVESSLIGFILEGMTIRNCGGECVRLKNFVTNAQVVNNTINDCGVYDYRFTHDGKNGEAIYVGTSSNQWTDGPDRSNYNLISGNMMVPYGNECIDVKEGATGNVIEKNYCAEQMDPNSGCYGSRGSGNIFRYNDGANCVGAGIRLGGWEVDGITYGTENEVYDNRFNSTGAGAIAARQTPQGVVCGNTCDEGTGDCEVVGEDADIMVTWNQGCPETLPIIPFIDDQNYIQPTFTTSSTSESTTQNSEDDISITTTSSKQESTTQDSEDGVSITTTSTTEDSTTQGSEEDDSSSATPSTTDESTNQGSDEDENSSATPSPTEVSTNQGDGDDADSSTGDSTTEEEELTTQGSDEDDSSGATPSPMEVFTTQGSGQDDSSSATPSPTEVFTNQGDGDDADSSTGDSTTEEEELTTQGSDEDDSSGATPSPMEVFTTQGSGQDDSSSATPSPTEVFTNQGDGDNADSSTRDSTIEEEEEEPTTRGNDDDDTDEATSLFGDESATKNSEDDDDSSSQDPTTQKEDDDDATHDGDDDDDNTPSQDSGRFRRGRYLRQ